MSSNAYSNMNTGLITTNIEFHEKEDSPVILFQDKEMIFGRIKVKSGTVPITNQPQFLYFSLDQSGSMQDSCPDGRSKMDHATHSIINIIKLIVKNKELNIWIQICSFDNIVDKIVDACKIDEDNFLEIINKLKLVIPRSMTNIEMALTTAKEEIEKFKKEHDDTDNGIVFNVTHILTTDGNANCGCIDKNILSEISDTSYNHIFIGFGLDHSVGLMNKLSSKTNTSYYFIDKIENSGLVFGEIMYKILYVCVKNMVLKNSCQNSNVEFYNYKTNEWTRSLVIDNEFTGDTEKTYNLRTLSPLDVEINIWGNTYPFITQTVSRVLNMDCYVPHLILNDQYDNNTDTDTKPTVIITDLTNDIFRQKTLELIYDSINLPKDNEYKKQLVSFLEYMKKYMEDNDKTRDEMLVSLCDDIYIVIKTYGTEYGNMYACARSRSNGREDSYNVTDMPITRNMAYNSLPSSSPPSSNSIPFPRYMARQTSCTYTNSKLVATEASVLASTDDDDNDYTEYRTIMENHILNTCPLTRHVTSEVKDIMREISNNM